MLFLYRWKPGVYRLQSGLYLRGQLDIWRYSRHSVWRGPPASTTVVHCTRLAYLAQSETLCCYFVSWALFLSLAFFLLYRPSLGWLQVFHDRNWLDKKFCIHLRFRHRINRRGFSSRSRAKQRKPLCLCWSKHACGWAYWLRLVFYFQRDQASVRHFCLDTCWPDYWNCCYYCSLCRHWHLPSISLIHLSCFINSFQHLLKRQYVFAPPRALSCSFWEGVSLSLPWHMPCAL